MADKKELIRRLRLLREVETLFSKKVEEYARPYVPFAEKLFLAKERFSRVRVAYDDLNREAERFSRAVTYGLEDGHVDEQFAEEFFGKVDRMLRSADRAMGTIRKLEKEAEEIEERVVAPTERIWAVLRAAVREDPEYGPVLKKAEDYVDPYAEDDFKGFLLKKD